MTQRLQQRVFLPLSLLIVLILGHLSAFWGGDVTGHFNYFTERLLQMDQGNWWVPSGPVMDTGLNLVSPLYSWFYAPVLLADNPIIGLWCFYLLLELISVGAFLLCSLRWRLMSPALAWTAALLLCVEPLTKTVKTENLTVAVHLTTPLFVLFLAGLRRAPWAMVVAGVLLGMAAQIHISALFSAPVLLLAVVRWSPRPSRALLSLAMGFALVLPISLFSITWAGGGSSAVEAAIPGGLSLWPLLQRVWREAPGGLTLAGALITAVTLARGRAARQLPEWIGAARLALGWSLSIYVLLTLALQMAASEGSAAPRYLALRPAGALLGAVALTWLASRLHELLNQRVRLAPLTVVSLLALALLGHGAWAATHTWQAWQRQQAAMNQSPGGLACALALHHREGRYMDRMYRALTHAGVSEMPGEITRVVGHEQRTTTDLVAWARRGQPPSAGDSTRGRNLLVAPSPDKTSTGEAVLVIPGALRLSEQPGQAAGELKVKLAEGLGRPRQIMIMISLSSQPNPVTLEAMINGAPADLVWGFMCRPGQEGERPRQITALLEPVEAGLLTLELRGLQGKVINWQVLDLPLGSAPPR